MPVNNDLSLRSFWFRLVIAFWLVITVAILFEIKVRYFPSYKPPACGVTTSDGKTTYLTSDKCARVGDGP